MFPNSFSIAASISETGKSTNSTFIILVKDSSLCHFIEPNSCGHFILLYLLKLFYNKIKYTVNENIIKIKVSSSNITIIVIFLEGYFNILIFRKLRVFKYLKFYLFINFLKNITKMRMI